MKFYLVRKRYQKALEKRDASWNDIQANKIPPDPTLDFLGKEWWKLPAVVSAALGISLAVAMWLRILPFGD